MNNSKIVNISRSIAENIIIDQNSNNLIINVDKCNPLISIVNTTCNNEMNITVNISEESFVKFNVFNYANNIVQTINVNLDGKNANFEFIESSINLDSSEHVMNIHHNYSYTKSSITKKGLNLGNKLKLIVNEYVLKDSSFCYVNQNSRIVNLSEGLCYAEPNLFIDNLDVIASHSATIGKFSESQIFYLESRGISRDDAIKLLIKGFLINRLEMVDKSIIYDMINKSLK